MKAFALALLAVLVLGSVAMAAPALPVLTVAAIHAKPPPVGTLVRIYGIVVDSYYCPPCPPGMTCKPCQHDTSITVADPGKPRGPSLLLSIAEAAEYLPNRIFRIDVTVSDRTQGGFDGHVESLGLP